MSTLEGTTMHPRCRHIGACWDLLEWFQLFSTSQNTSKIQFRTFLEKNPIFGFPWCNTREDLSVDVSITYVGLILTKLKRISFLGVRTDRQTRFWNPHMETCWHKKKKFQLKAQNYLLAVDPYMPPRRSGMHNTVFTYIYVAQAIELTPQIP